MVMARIYINCGRYEEAIDELEVVLSLESDYTVNYLKFEYWIDPLRDDPRFLATIERYR